MTLAEQIRSQIDLQKELPWLKNDVANAIKACGEYCIICDTHIDKITRGWAVPNKYYAPICEWARKEGLSTRPVHNSYGVKHIEITL